MSSKHPAGPGKSIPFGLAIAALAALVTAVLLWTQIRREQREGLDDLTRRAQLLTHRVQPLAREALGRQDVEAPATFGDRLDGHARLLGLVAYSADGRVVAAGEGLNEVGQELAPMAREALAADAPVSELRRDTGGTTHVLVERVVGAEGRPIGAVAVLHDAVYLEDRLTRGVLHAALWSLGIGLGMFLITTGLAWAVFERPLLRLAEWMRRLRFGNTPELPPGNIPVGRLADETVHLAASFRAARAKEQVEAGEAVRSDKAWTRERLRAHAINALSGQPLVVVSNREPYVHQYRGGKPVVTRPAGGLVTGLDPVLRACGGMWVAQGSGDADRITADRDGCVPVPPEDPRYTLKRVFISKEEEQGYYYGFSNEGLWPLCHLTHERPVFRAGDWDQYVRANQRFADAVLEEIGPDTAVVMVQDYQMALVPGMIKQRRPDMRVGLFWHIPWPSAESFRICPYRVELLNGMLGADLLGFHLQQHCNNFFETVDRMLEAKLDRDRFAVEIKGHTALVRPFPISVQSWQERGVATGEKLLAQIADLRRQHRLEGVMVGVGVDRIDYTKGITERLRAIERLFDKHPEMIGKFTFVQLGAPSRTHIPRYRDMVTDLEELADQINWKFRTEGWEPVRMLVGQHEGPLVYAFFKMAEVCIVSSLHDGMNLVAKEYVAAQSEADDLAAEVQRGPGTLVLSEFAGAARDLPEALIINPYDTEQFAAAIHQAITMEPAERRSRMTRMKERVEEYNIYRWAAEFLAALAQADGRKESGVPEAAGTR